MIPKLHLAFDTYNTEDTIKMIDNGIKDHIDIIECGGSLIFQEGLNAVTSIKKAFPDKEIVTDIKMACELMPYYGKQFRDSLCDSMIMVSSHNDAVTGKAMDIAKEIGLKVYIYLNLQEDEIPTLEMLEGWKSIGLDHVIYHSNHLEAPFWRESDYRALDEINKYGFSLSVTGKITTELIKTFSNYNIYSFIIGTGITGSDNPVEKLKEYKQCIVDSFDRKEE